MKTIDKAVLEYKTDHPGHTTQDVSCFMAGWLAHEQAITDRYIANPTYRENALSWWRELDSVKQHEIVLRNGNFTYRAVETLTDNEIEYLYTRYSRF